MAASSALGSDQPERLFNNLVLRTLANRLSSIQPVFSLIILNCACALFLYTTPKAMFTTQRN